MKEKRFIELLNLYVDHQLDAAGTGELEAELRDNPARHRTYSQYTRMQKACSLLFEAERSNAPSASILARAMARADQRVGHPAAPRPAWHRGLLAFGGFAVAAACLALVLARFNGGPAAAPVSGDAQVAAAATPEAAGAPSGITKVEIEKPMYAVVTVPGWARAESPAYPVVNIRQFAAFEQKSTDGLATPAMLSYVDSTGLKWTQDVRIRPIRQMAPDSLFLDRRALPSEEMRALLDIQPAGREPVEEMTVLQFQH
ncbi:MAG: hypothetical protein LBM92_07330 [Opitutaceae bacterium]|jgi:hypothetical protein|nr:hypothetical protein [Opitutaceae bacterium]